MLWWLPDVAWAFEDLRLVASVTALETREDGTVVAWVDRGALDGVIPGTSGQLMRPADADSNAVGIGRIDVLEVRRRRTLVGVDAWYPEEWPALRGDVVSVNAAWEPTADATRAEALARNGIFVHDARGRPLYTWADVARRPDRVSDAEICARAARDVGGTPEDACRLLSVVDALLPSYLGMDLSFHDLWAQWEANGRPLAPVDLAEQALALPDSDWDTFLGGASWVGDVPERWHIAVEQGVDTGDPDLERLSLLFLRFAELQQDANALDLAHSARAIVHASAGRWEEAIAERQLALETTSEPWRRAWTLRRIGDAWEELDRDEEAIAAYRAAVREQGDAPDGWAHRDLGHRLRLAGYNAQSEEPLLRAIELLEANAGPAELMAAANARVDLGLAYAELGRPAEAAAVLEAAAAGAHALLEPRWEANAWDALGDVLWHSDPVRARDAKIAAFHLFLEAGRTDWAASRATDAGMLSDNAGDPGAALEWTQRAIDVARPLGPSEGLADALARMSMLQLQQGDGAAALGLLDEALAVAEAAGERGTLAHVWMRVGEARAETGDPAGASAAYATATELADRTDDVRLRASIAVSWGNNVPADAEAAYARAEALYRDMGDIGALAETLLQHTAHLHGEEAVAMGREAAALADRIGDAVLRARADLAIAPDLRHTDPAAAEALLLGARPVFEAAGKAFELVAVDRWLAQIAVDRLDPDAALRWAESARTHGEVAHMYRAAALLLVAQLRYDRGETDLARVAADEAAAEAARHDIAYVEAGAYRLLSDVHSRRGATRTAEAFARRAIDVDRAAGNPTATHTARLAELAFFRGDRAEGRARAEEAMATAEPGDWVTPFLAGLPLAADLADSGDVAAALATLDRLGGAVPADNLLGQAYLELYRAVATLDSDPASAEAHAAAALALCPPAERGARATILGVRARALASLADPGAEAALRETLAELTATDQPAWRWRVAWELAAVLHAGGRVEEAVPYGLEAVAGLDRLLRDAAGAEGRATLLSVHGEVYDGAAALFAEAGRAEDAWRVTQARQAQDLDAVAGADLTGEEAAAADEVSALESRRAAVAAELSTADPIRAGVLQAELDEIDARRRDFVRDLQRRYPDLAERLHVDPADLSDLQARLAPGEAFVEPVVLPDKVVLFVVRPDRVAHREVPVTEAVLDALVADLRDALAHPRVAWPTRGVRVIAADPGGSGPADPTEAARKLYDVLLRPIEGDLDGVTTLVTAPSGKLRYVPFAVLWDGEGFAVERWRMSLLTRSGATLEHRALDPRAGVLAIADPDGSLPGAAAEVEAMRKVWGRRRVDVLAGGEATEDALREHLPGHRILHLATHGILLDATPRESYLVLAGEGDAARLTLREITLLPAAELDLVVLSACETAVGSGDGDAIAGLAYQFEVRDASAVVASLWAVSDESTSRWMVELYEALREPGTTRSEAVRAAQLALLADERWRHPYYWAPFVLIGDWR